MKMRAEWVWFVALLTILIFSGCAAAEEGLVEYSADLISDGRFPSAHFLTAKAVTVTQAEFDEAIIPHLEGYTLGPIDVYGMRLTEDQFLEMYQSLLNHNPHLFYVSGTYSCALSSRGYVAYLYPHYRYNIPDDAEDDIEYDNPADKKTITRLKKVFDSGVSGCVSYASSAETVIGKMLRANDYFCLNYQYDDSLSYYSPIELFEKKTGVCNAYCLAYLQVMKEMGINGTVAISKEMDHIWNLVEVDGSWYHVDVTWNDPSGSAPYGAGHNFFLLSDAGIQAAGHSGWTAAVSASNTQYDDFFWRKVDQIFPMSGDTLYYVADTGANTRTIYLHNLLSGSSAPIYTYDFVAETYFVGVDPVWISNHRIYFAMGGRLYSVLWDGTDQKLEYEDEDENMHIVYIGQTGDKMMMYLTGDFVSGKVIPFEMEILRSVQVEPAGAYAYPSDTIKLSVKVSPAPDTEKPLTYTSSDESVATVDENGIVSVKGVGVSTITCALDDISFGTSVVISQSRFPVVLPESTRIIEESAFSFVAAEHIVLPEALETVYAGAFSGCPNLKIVIMPTGEVEIDSQAFDKDGGYTLVVKEESAAAAFAAENGIKHVFAP